MEVSFVPESPQTEEAMEEFSKVLKQSDKVLYAKGKQSLNRLNEILDPNQIVDFVFYDTVTTEFPQVQSQHLLFTSPSNVNAYFDRYNLRDDQHAYAIGQTTAHALKARGHEPEGIAKEPGEKGFWEIFF